MRKNKLLPIIGIALFISPLAACGNSGNEKTTILRVLNMEDYIYVQDENDGYYEIDLVNQFEEYVASDEELSEKYGKVQVIYDTTDTNETLYSEMQTGKALYDLICPSDYMIQKLLSSDMIIPLDKSQVPNYFGTATEESKASKVIKGIFDNISTVKMSDSDKNPIYLADYAVGYMWGTLGILFNPEYNKFINRGYDKDEVIGDLETWEVLWNNKYNNTISVKDSMRDTYAVGLIHTYLEDLLAIQEEYYAVLRSMTASDEAKEEALTIYKNKFDTIFNKCDEDTVRAVEIELGKLKENVFGLEVDSGKEDIITDKIGINLAWSGDAVYSMDQGEDVIKVGEDGLKELCYSVPTDGSNLWFDGWVMPKLDEKDRTQDQFDLAHLFLDFLCEPANVAQNMDYIGYTSFMGGDDTLDLVRSWYDVRYEDVYYLDEEENEYPVYVLLGKDAEENNIFSDDPISYLDCVVAHHDDTLDTNELYYQIEEVGEDDNGQEVITYSYEPVIIVNDNDEEVTKTYGDLFIVDGEGAYENVRDINGKVLYNEDLGLQKVSLEHIFDGTLSEYGEEDMWLYTETYYYVNAAGEISNSVGRQFYCQYPDLETLNRCSVMKDYRENNVNVMNMWERFKSNSLPTWAIILFIVEIALVIGLIVYFVINKYIKKKLRLVRKNNQ